MRLVLLKHRLSVEGFTGFLPPLMGRGLLQVPCSLIYGEHDWMKPENGRQEFDSILKQRGKLNEADLQVRRKLSILAKIPQRPCKGMKLFHLSALQISMLASKGRRHLN